MTVLVVGGGHNGLVAACYLARAGRDVLVLEASDRLGGGSRTEPTIAGHLFNTHSAAHNIINMTSIPAELELEAAGLDYIEMAPFATGFGRDGRVARFERSIEATAAGLPDGDAYLAFMHRAVPLVQAAVAGLDPTPGRIAKAVLPALRGLVRNGGPLPLARDLTAPYGALLETALNDELTRASVASFASHSSAGPHAPGGSFYVFWQAAYHLFGQWHARGGSQGLTDALERRLKDLGGSTRTGAVVERITTDAGRVTGVVLEGGERIDAPQVVSAVDVQSALLDLLDPPLAGQHGRELAAAHRGNAVQLVVHLSTDRLPPYPGGREGDWNGLQSHVDSVEQLRRGFLDAEAHHLPTAPPTYCFTPSVYDDSLAPAGRHTVYLACPSAPYDVEGGWDRHAEPFAEAMIAQTEQVAPGFAASIRQMHVRTPTRMAQELRWPGAHPMFLDISLDQLGPLRPTRALARHRVPGVFGLVTCGASTGPVGGIAGSSGKAAAGVLLKQ